MMMKEAKMRLLDHPGITKVAVGARLTLPDPKVYRVLTVETDMPLSKKQSGYDQDQFDRLIHAVAQTMEEIGADQVDIHAVDNPNPMITASRASAG